MMTPHSVEHLTHQQRKAFLQENKWTSTRRKGGDSPDVCSPLQSLQWQHRTATCPCHNFHPYNSCSAASTARTARRTNHSHAVSFAVGLSACMDPGRCGILAECPRRVFFNTLVMPIHPGTLLMTTVVWLFSVLPLIVLRKSQFTGESINRDLLDLIFLPTAVPTPSSPSQRVKAARSKPHTLAPSLYILTSILSHAVFRSVGGGPWVC